MRARRLDPGAAAAAPGQIHSPIARLQAGMPSRRSSGRTGNGN
jgi:hypothetical protein